MRGRETRAATKRKGDLVRLRIAKSMMLGEKFNREDINSLRMETYFCLFIQWWNEPLCKLLNGDHGDPEDILLQNYFKKLCF